MSLTEGTYVVINSIDDDDWEYEYEQTGSLNEKVESWYWLCLWIFPLSLPLTNSRKINKYIKWEKIRKKYYNKI